MSVGCWALARGCLIIDNKYRSAHKLSLLLAGAAAIYPVMLYSTLAPENSLTAYGVAASRATLVVASIWWPVGFALAVVYFVFISRRYAGKVSVRRDTQGFY